MLIKVLVPVIGESVTEAQIAQWLVENGQKVEKDDEIAEIDSEKATITISADAAGTIKIMVPTGEIVKIGTLIAEIDASDSPKEKIKETKSTPKGTTTQIDAAEKNEDQTTVTKNKLGLNMTPLARKIIDEENIDVSSFSANGTAKKISKREAMDMVEKQRYRKTTAVKMSMLRRKLSERLVAVKNQTAMLTTFNEVDMSAIISLRKQYQEDFVAKHGIKLGFMSFFVKAVTIALKDFPEVNAALDGDSIIYHDYADISIAVSTDKGLMVPVIRNAELLMPSEIEKELTRLSEKARQNKISIDDMTGGTFTITNGGIFGSMLSTPIINPPQSAILGMHNIQDRAVVIDGQIAIRPMMYLALSYDHRIIDGKESVGFIIRLKELLENPMEMLKGSIL